MLSQVINNQNEKLLEKEHEIRNLKSRIELAKEIVKSLINNPYGVTVGDIDKARKFLEEK